MSRKIHVSLRKPVWLSVPRSYPKFVDYHNLLWSVLSWRLGARLSILGLSFGAAVSSLAAPFFQKVFVDRLLGVHSQVTIEPLEGLSPGQLLWGAFFMVLLGQFLSLAANYVGVREGAAMQKVLGQNLYEKMLATKNEALKGRTSGEVVSLFATDVSGSTALLEQSLPSAAAIVFPLFLGPWAIWYFYRVPLWATLVFVGVVLVINSYMSNRQSKLFLRFKQLAAERTGLVNEWIQNLRALRILGRTEAFEKKLFSKREEETRHRVRMVTNGQTMSSLGSSINFFLNFIGVLSLTYLRKGQVTPGEILAFLWILGVFLARPFRQLPWMFTWALDAWTSLKRVQDFMKIENREQEIGREHFDSPAGPPALLVRGLSLELSGKKILDNISFSVEEGEFIGIVGEVGSGKSLLLQSLLNETSARFCQLRIFGEDLSLAKPESRRQYFSFVPQEGFIFSGSIYENVRLEYGGDSDLQNDLPLIESALQVAQFKTDLGNFPDGLKTELGERGVNLSGGQKQRLNLARAVVFQRPIVLLDDSLSAVDVETERLLVDSLIFGEWTASTRLLVTHRLSVLRKVDRILFLKDGRLFASGKLSALLAAVPEFREFVQSMSEEAADVSIQPSSGAPLPEDSSGAESETKSDHHIEGDL